MQTGTVRHLILLTNFSVLSTCLFLCSADAKTHAIQFGGAQGYTYSPNSFSVVIGDTIKLIGDFNINPLHSLSIPAGAHAFGPVSSGDTFTYVVKVAGEYSYQYNIHGSEGMTGSFTAVTPHYGLTNEGREFYLGMLYPSYNTVEYSQELSAFNVFALISTYYENDVSVSYFDAAGKEGAPTQYHILAGNLLKLPLNVLSMQVDTASDVPANKSCHIKSTQPITVYYVSNGACAGGSYLALPVLGLGRNYVAACYNDNPRDGGFNSVYFEPHGLDYSAGEFMVVGTEDLTTVKIIPATTSVTGHLGANTGNPYPYTIKLNRGQCYLVRSNGRNSDNDMSGSVIESSSPVAVISGHENAYLGGVDGYGLDSRDFMIEQMTPVEFWDSVDYISVPLVENSPPGNDGHGDSYRIYAFDSANIKVHLDVQGISGGYDFTTLRLVPPSEKSEITAPVVSYSTNGKKFALMQYDERSISSTGNPSPCPSMMTIVPMSRWKTSYFVPSSYFSSKFLAASSYINVIGSNLGNISVSLNGTVPNRLSILTHLGFFNNIPNHNLYATQYRLGAANNNSYYLSSSDPFVVYLTGFQNSSPNGTGIGDPTSFSFYDEYAAPAGMQLNTGVTPSFIVSTTTTCSGWHICVRDTGTNDPGLKAVIAIDDTDGIYWQQPGAKTNNVSFDQTSNDYVDGELHPHVHSSQSYCFDIYILNPLSASSAPLAIVDNLGNAVILRLDRTASTLSLSTNPPTSSRPDSIVFPVKKIGDQICTTFVFKNTAARGGTALNLTSASFTNSDTAYKIQSIIPSLPHSLAAQDSLMIQVCYTSADSARHQDSLVMKTDCFNVAISLDAHGSTGLIDASDLDFGSVQVADTVCRNLIIKNVGTAPFTLTKQFILSDKINFSVDKSKLPVLIQPGNSISINVCFFPESEDPFSAGIDWGTDLITSFAHSVKSHSVLTGIGIAKLGVKASSAPITFNIHPNPVSGNSVIVSFDQMNGNASLNVYDVLGREVYHHDILIGLERLEIPIQNFPAGTYYARISSSGGIVTQSFVKIK